MPASPPTAAPTPATSSAGHPTDWLALGAASRLLGVDPDTLRRWADEGRVEAFTTPGGHRRFARRSLERIVATRRTGPTGRLRALGATPDRVSAVYRRRYEVPTRGAPDPRSSVPATEHDAYREQGRLLVAALLAHLDAPTASARDRAAQDALGLTADLGRRLATMGMPLGEAVASFVNARRPFLTGARRAGSAARAGRRSSQHPVRSRHRAPRSPALPAHRLSLRGRPDPPRGGRVHLLDGVAIEPRRGSPRMTILLPAATSILALIFAVALIDQWRERRQAFQLVWAFGMLFYSVAAGCEALAAASGWNEGLYRTWYLTGAVWTAGWLGLGTAFLLARTRFGYAFALSLFLAGLFTFLVRNKPEYAGAGTVPLLYFIVAGILALAIAVETYFANDRWPRLAAGAVVGATVLSIVLMLVVTLPAPGYAVDPATNMPARDALPARPPAAHAVPQYHRRVRPHPRRGLLDVRVHAQATGAAVLARCAPEGRRVPVQPAHRAHRDRGEPRRIPARRGARSRDRQAALARARDILIAIGAFIPTLTDSLNRFGTTELFQLGKFLGVVFLFAGFLVSIDVFREIRIPFTSVRLATARRERPRPVDAHDDEDTETDADAGDVAVGATVRS